jgi:hypothetical protein
MGLGLIGSVGVESDEVGSDGAGFDWVRWGRIR